METTDGEYSGNKISRFTGHFREYTLYRVHTTTGGSQSTHYNDYIQWMSYNVYCTHVLWFYMYVGTQSLTTTNVVIDGYTVNSTLNSTATLPLGTTVILVCRLSGIPHAINYLTIAINITSTRDGGTYTCYVTVEGREASQQFQLRVTGQWS